LIVFLYYDDAALFINCVLAMLYYLYVVGICPTFSKRLPMYVCTYVTLLVFTP